MAIKLVDATQLDSNLTSVANAIRTKSGGSGTLTFPNGFISEIGNISEIASGTWTLSSDNKTVQVDVDFEPTHAICYANTMNYADWTSSWQQFGIVMLNNILPYYFSFQVRNLNDSFNTNLSRRAISEIGYNNGKFTFYDAGYPFVAGKTYTWFCWRESS